jgi:hypothetical protein
MTVDKDSAIKLWKAVFGNVVWARDCFGSLMHIDAYNNDVVSMKWTDGKSYDMSWNVDHIRPVKTFEKESEADFWNNLEPMHRQNNQTKSDNFPHFEIEGEKYTVVRCDICSKYSKPGYGIKNVTTGHRIDWKAKQNKCL